MHNQQSAHVYEAVERETARTAYPEAFPALPEVPTGRYSDPQFHDLEMQHLWRKTWLHAGHASELPTPGSYKLFEQLGLSIIISRGLGGEIRAFHNICRHRASALLLEKQGVARRFVCPYHNWGYSLDGSLTSVPREHDFSCLDKSKRGLLPVRCESMRGMIFVNLDQGAQSLADFLAPIERQIGDLPMYQSIAGINLPIAGPFEDERFAFADWGMTCEAIQTGIFPGRFFPGHRETLDSEQLYLAQWHSLSSHPIDIERRLMLGETVYTGSAIRVERVDRSAIELMLS
jgi:nitrite reductase/ring-hydroxylating ferredoxin subunit